MAAKTPRCRRCGRRLRKTAYLDAMARGNIQNLTCAPCLTPARGRGNGRQRSHHGDGRHTRRPHSGEAEGASPRPPRRGTDADTDRQCKLGPLFP